MDTTPGDTFY